MAGCWLFAGVQTTFCASLKLLGAVSTLGVDWVMLDTTPVELETKVHNHGEGPYYLEHSFG